MSSHGIIEGTGKEIAEFAYQHPHERFRLLPLEISPETPPAGPDAETWAEVMDFIHLYKGKLPVLPPGATSTDALYD